MRNIVDLIDRSRAWEAIHNIVMLMLEKRRTLTESDWKEYVRSEVSSSKIRQFAHLCPLTRRNYEKPRGYAGDAVMMDLIYGLSKEVVAAELDELGEEVYRYTSGSPACRAVRYRRKLLSKYIDAACAESGKNTNILSLACGHLREAEIAKELAAKNFSSFIAFDQDAESLKVVADDYGKYGVKATQGSVKNIITGRKKFESGSYDLVYSAGLYDYLSQDVAIRLTRNILEAVRPGGKLLLANFLPNIPDVGYMESLMDWWLIYRSDEEMKELTSELGDKIRGCTLFHDPDDNIVFLEIVRA